MGYRDKPYGVSSRRAERLQALLKPGEQLRYVFRAQTNVTAGRLLMEFLGRGANFTGHVDVVITDRAILFLDQTPLVDDPRVLADLPLQPTFGPVTGHGWIHIDGQPVYAVGGWKVIERAEAALRT